LLTQCRASTLPATHSPEIEILKSSLLGLAVFGVYDVVLSAAHRRQGRMVEEDHSGKNVKMAVVDSDRISLAGHAGAGAVAGFAQSVLLDGYELALSYYGWRRQQREEELRRRQEERPRHDHDAQKQRQDRNAQLFRVNKQVIVRRAVHDSIGFAALFGTYEATRRYLEERIRSGWHPGSLPLEAENEFRVPAWDGSRHEDNDEDLSSARGARGHHRHDDSSSVESAIATFVAGGVAGQAHLIVNHYTHNLYSTEHRKAKVNSQRHLSQSPARRFVVLQSHPPKAIAVFGAFLPSGLCFLAFRYGGALAETLLNDLDEAR
jgi:hypothetical protein